MLGQYFLSNNKYTIKEKKNVKIWAIPYLKVHTFTLK